MRAAILSGASISCPEGSPPLKIPVATTGTSRYADGFVVTFTAMPSRLEVASLNPYMCFIDTWPTGPLRLVPDGAHVSEISPKSTNRDDGRDTIAWQLPCVHRQRKETL